MKRTELVKNLAMKIRGQMTQAAVPGRFGTEAAALPDRREQRKLDQAAGLVPFAVKLNEGLVKQLRELAAADGGDLNALTARLIQAGLKAAGQTAAQAPQPKPAAEAAPKAAAKTAPVTEKKTPAKKAASAPAAVKKAVAKKAAAQPAPAKKAVADKTVAKKAAAKKAPPKAAKASR